jgi:diphthamide biosynthesis methyltransferase
MYKAINKEGERRLFHHLTEACEFAGKSYHSVYRAFKLGKAVDGIKEVHESEVYTLNREEVESIVKNTLEECKYVYLHMEPDGSILFV